MKNFCLLLLFGFIAGTLLARIESAHAVAPFKKEFDAKYVKTAPATPEETALAAAVTKVKCNVCHVGKKKTDRNAYGNALSELLDRKKDYKNKAKINEALDKVAAMKSNPDDPNSPTFGDLINQGKLPCEEEDAAQAAK
jgi:cytochrome c2